MRKVSLLAVMLAYAACGGQTEQVPPLSLPPVGTGDGFPPLSGCENDELVTPTGRLRLLAHGMIPSGSISGTDEYLFFQDEFGSLDHRLTRIDRRDGAIAKVSFSGAAGIVYGDRVYTYGIYGPYGVYTRGFYVGGLHPETPLVLVDAEGTWASRPKSISASSGVVLYQRGTRQNEASTHWWDPVSGKGDDIEWPRLPGCWRQTFSVLRGQAVVVGEELGNLECGGSQEQERVNFLTRFGDRVVESPRLVTPSSTTVASWADATSRSAVVDLNGLSLFDLELGYSDISTKNLGLAEESIGQAVVVRDRLLVAAESRTPKVEDRTFNVYDFGLDRKPLTGLLGTGRGSLSASAHDKRGAYFLSYDGTESLLWVVDFADGGCPP